MPLTTRVHRSRAQGQFAKAHKQLLNAGFLAKVEWLENNNIRYYPGPKAIYDFDNAQRELTRQMALPFNPRDQETPREKVTLQIEGTKNAPDGLVTLELIPDGSGNSQQATKAPQKGK